MAEQAVSQLKSVRPRLSAPSLAALRARAWMVGPPLLFGLLGALIAASLLGTAWRGEAEVFFDQSNLVLAATDTSSGGDPTTYLEFQAKRARSPVLARRVVRAAQVPGLTAAEFLRHSTAKPETDADILKLSVSDGRRAPAVRLSNAYASEFIRFKNELDLRSVNEALREIRSQIERLRAGGLLGTPAYKALVQMQRELRTLGMNMLRNTSVRRPADGASSFRPHALRNGLIGGAVGVLLGVALVGVATRRRRLRQ